MQPPCIRSGVFGEYRGHQVYEQKEEIKEYLDPKDPTAFATESCESVAECMRVGAMTVLLPTAQPNQLPKAEKQTSKVKSPGTRKPSPKTYIKIKIIFKLLSSV
jgi:hypothetical protein